MNNKILITGASGVLGKHLLPLLLNNKMHVETIGRTKKSNIMWNLQQGKVTSSNFGKAQTIVHLAGESIANKHWSNKQKKYILDNRKALAEYVCKQAIEHNIPNIVVASAVGFYGKSSKVLDETAPKGHGFTCDVCEAIEKAFEPAINAGIRVVFLRLGVIFSRFGGALPKLVKPFNFYMGGFVGDGKQSMSWVDGDDAARAILFAMQHKNIKGAINVVSPQCVTNKELSLCIGQLLKKPCWLNVPAIIINMLLGEMGQALLLDSVKVYPKKLLEYGFKFKYDFLEKSLKNQFFNN